MSDITVKQVHELARLAGLDLDNARAEAIAARLGTVLAELDAIPGEALQDVEPLPTSGAEGGPQGSPGR